MACFAHDLPHFSRAWASILPFCRPAGSQAVTVLTDTKLVPSADAAFKVLEAVFPLRLVLLASFFGGVVVAARSQNGL